VIAEGEGGLLEAAAHLPDDDSRYVFAQEGPQSRDGKDSQICID